MEPEEVVRKRREKILGRMDPSEREQCEERDDQSKFKVVQELKQLESRINFARWALSVGMGVLAAILNAHFGKGSLYARSEA